MRVIITRRYLFASLSAVTLIAVVALTTLALSPGRVVSGHRHPWRPLDLFGANVA